MTSSARFRARKALVVTLVSVAFVLFLGFIALDPYYYTTRPRQPDPQSGRVYCERVKGASGVADVYLTRTEKLPYDYSGWILGGYAALFLTASVLNQRWSVIYTPQSQLPKKF